MFFAVAEVVHGHRVKVEQPDASENIWGPQFLCGTWTKGGEVEFRQQRSLKNIRAKTQVAELVVILVASNLAITGLYPQSPAVVQSVAYTHACCQAWKGKGALIVEVANIVHTASHQQQLAAIQEVLALRTERGTHPQQQHCQHHEPTSPHPPTT